MNTTTVVGLALLGFSAIGVLPYVQKRVEEAKEKIVAENKPASNTAWVEEIVAAAGAKATAEFILKHLRAGSTAAEVMADRIKELEGAPAL